MDAAYKIVGGDGIEYGPVSLPDLRNWIAEGRIAADTRILRNDQSSWRPASGFPELGFGRKRGKSTPSPSMAMASAHVLGTAGAALEQSQVKSGASWFYWVAGLSLINALAPRLGFRGDFMVGLGITQPIEQIAHEMGAEGLTTALVAHGLLAGLFALFGLLGQSRQSWAYLVGMGLYLLDSLLLPLDGRWFALAFHGFVLYSLWRGFAALRKLRSATWQ
jgi:hypothetical protein